MWHKYKYSDVPRLPSRKTARIETNCDPLKRRLRQLELFLNSTLQFTGFLLLPEVRAWLSEHSCKNKPTVQTKN